MNEPFTSIWYMRWYNSTETKRQMCRSPLNSHIGAVLKLVSRSKDQNIGCVKLHLIPQWQCIVWMRDSSECSVHGGEMGQTAGDTVSAHACLHSFACECIQELSHADLILTSSAFLSVSLWLSLSHLNLGSEASRYLRCFSWVKITFTLTQRGRSIPGVELKSGRC